MKETIIIRSFGPLKEVEIDGIKPFTFFIGISGSGKSTLLKITAFMRWVYKMMCIRSYLFYSGINTSPFKFNFKYYLKNMGMEGFLHEDTYIEFRRGDFAIVYDRKGGRFSKNYVPREELSLEKVSFISDKRNLIGDLLENNISLKKRAYYANETFEDYLLAVEAIRRFDVPSLGVRLQVKKMGSRKKHVVQPMDGASDYTVNLNESSSGTQATIPLLLIVEYYSKHFDIVDSLNNAVFRYVSKSDRLKDFQASRNVGELPFRRVSLFVEEPEISLFPATQRQLIDVMVADCMRVDEYRMEVMVATHSPYVINHLNVLLRRKGDAPSVSAGDLGVYNVADGRLQDLMSQDLDTQEWVVDTDVLSEPMERIYNEYMELGL